MRRGSKYDPLRDHLIRCRKAEVSLTFEEIEDILGFGLCASAETPQWWANVHTPAQRTQLRSWRDAGYDAFLTSDRASVRFVRIVQER